MSIELKQAAQQALDAFDTFGDDDDFASLFALNQKMNALRTALQQAEAQQPAQATQAEVTDSMIREAFLANGFTIKDGHSDLKPYVYAAARAILALHPVQAEAQPAEGGEADTGPRVLREVFALCEATEHALHDECNAHSVQDSTLFSRGRLFEAKSIRKAIGTWFQDEFCGRSFMGEPVATPPATPEPVKDERDQLRCAQADAVMPLIGPLLDAWENADREVISQEPELSRQLKAINNAMEGAQPATGEPVAWNSIQIASWIGSQLMHEPSMFERAAVCKFVRSLGRHPTLLKHSPKIHPAPGVPEDVARDAISTVREQYRGTDWGKAAECICDAIDAAMLAANKPSA